MITDIEQDFSQKSLQKYIKIPNFIKTPNIHIFKMAAPTEDLLPQTETNYS